MSAALGPEPFQILLSSSRMADPPEIVIKLLPISIDGP